MTTPDAPNIGLSANVHLRNLAACTPGIHHADEESCWLTFGDLTLHVWDGSAGLVALRDALTAHLEAGK